MVGFTLQPLNSDDDVVIFLKNTRGIKILPPNRRVKADSELQRKLGTLFGEENVKILTKPIEKCAEKQ